ncbi:hypothetical protein MYX06_04635 [Patescibacteria group bacterium AH-259-L05]|nr:hypothetical protein [Patescibacteria group bacterium AH-259-L05]
MQEELKKIIQNSGNNLHMRVVDKLEALGWDVDLNSYYYDDTAGKPREIDIVASRLYLINDSFQNPVDSFKIYFFIECKYFSKDICFRLHKVEDRKKIDAIILWGLNKDEVLRSGLAQKHHYLLESDLAIVYDTIPKNQNKIFNALTQPVKSLSFFKERRPTKAFYYPIVVYDGIPGVYYMESITDLNDLDSLRRESILTFGVNYSYKSVVSDELNTQYFCIDFIHFNKLKYFLDNSIKPEADEIVKFLHFRLKK